MLTVYIYSKQVKVTAFGFWMFWLYLHKVKLRLSLILTTLLVHSAHDKLAIYFFFSPENRIWHWRHFAKYQIYPHPLPNHVSGEKYVVWL